MSENRTEEAIVRSATSGRTLSTGDLEPTPGEGRRAGGPLDSLKDFAKFAAAPGGLVIALAFYFGWVRTQALALYFGIDPSTLGLSVQDYLLRSVDALFAPLGALLLIGLAGGWIHVRVSNWIAKGRRPDIAMWTSYGLMVAGGALLALAVVAVLQGLPFRIHFLAEPLSPGLGIILLAYGIYMRRALLQRLGRPSPHGSSYRMRSATATLVVMIVVLSLFWTVSEYAAALGRGRAQQIEANISLLPGVTVYSRNDLQLGEARLIVAQGDSASYRYRYSGLRFIIRSGGNYFLLPDGWSRSDGVVIVLRDDANIRVEFTTGSR
jgi:hypothetical protein